MISLRLSRRAALVAAAAVTLALGCEARPVRLGAASCSRCHGSADNPAPPNSIRGDTSTTVVEVGAHQLHLRDTPIRAALACSECHVVPNMVGAPGHFDGPHARITWGALASARGAAPRWDRDARACSGVYCHGATLRAPPSSPPVWTYVAEPALSPPSAEACGSCHGYPPPAPHPASTNCHNCHPGTVQSDGAIDVAGGLHIDGKLDVAGNLSCTACHGDEARAPTALNPALPAAPPVGTRGETLPMQRAVGAHQAHLNDGPYSRAMACGECHAVPGDLTHVDGRVALVWGSIATDQGKVTPLWNDTSCASTYCHGAFRNGNASNAPVWTGGSAQAACGSCHTIPPGGTHPQNNVAACGGCHPGYTSTSVNLDLHVNGRLDFGGTGTGCAGCHGAPPATGAHLAHYGDTSDPPLTTAYGDLRILQDYYPSGASYYMFGCGNCHPLDPVKHGMNIPNAVVELFDPTAPAGSLKARASPTAAYEPNGKTCSGVYCHSSGQENPAYVTTPTWSSGTKLGCNGCHDNPPRYLSGGAGTATANTHLVLADDGWEFGHFGGLPGPWHWGGSKHGGDGWGPTQDASAITCQTCHYATTDPSNAGPSGFYYLDTGGDYDLGGSLGYACSSCHALGDPAKPTGTGRVLPLRHVNGSREVVFDPRASLPGIPWLPPDPNTPTRPNWVTKGSVSGWPVTVVLDGSTASFSLGAVGYEPATKTCSNVACHLNQTSVRWGLTPVGNASCDYCHQFRGIPPPP